MSEAGTRHAQPGNASGAGPERPDPQGQERMR
jgi:hypothetical protein